MTMWICPYCRERVSIKAFYAKGHATKNCPMTTEQMKQLGVEEE